MPIESCFIGFGTYILKFPPTKNWRAIAADRFARVIGKIRYLEKLRLFF